MSQPLKPQQIINDPNLSNVQSFPDSLQTINSSLAANTEIFITENNYSNNYNTSVQNYILGDVVQATSIPSANDAPANPQVGDIYFNTLSNEILVYNGVTWIASATTATAANTYFAPSGSITAANVQAAIEQLDANMLTAAGGTLTGPLILSGTPTLALEATTKQYVDTQVSLAQEQPFTPNGNLFSVTIRSAINELDTEKLAINGGNMLGPLVLDADPTLALQAATKQYVDTKTIPLGTNGQVLFVDNNFATGDAGFTYDLTTDTLTVANTVDTVDLAASGNGVFGGNVTVAGNVTGVQATFTGNLAAANAVLNGNVTVTGNITAEDADFTGNASITGNLAVSNAIIANIAQLTTPTGIAPISVNSTTRVANLNVAHANVSDYSNVDTVITGVYYPTMVSAATTANYELGVNAAVSFDAATGALNSTLLGGVLTTAAQPNVTAVGTLFDLAVAGNVVTSNLTVTNSALFSSANSNITGNLNVAGNAKIDGNVQVGGNINTINTTFGIANTVATTIEMGGAASVITAGAVGGLFNVRGNIAFDKSLTFTDANAAVNDTSIYYVGGLNEALVISLNNSSKIQINNGRTVMFGDVLNVGSSLIISPTGKIGYINGAGSDIIQIGARTAAVTINTPSGNITLAAAAGSTTATSFTVNNTVVGENDTIIVNQRSGADKYMIGVTNVTNGSFELTFFTTGGTTVEQPVFNYNVISGISF